MLKFKLNIRINKPSEMSTEALTDVSQAHYNKLIKNALVPFQCDLVEFHYCLRLYHVNAVSFIVWF